MYRELIQRDIHVSHRGLKHDPGLSWLNGILEQLETRGLGQLVNFFTSSMGVQHLLAGLLVEVTLADHLCRTFPNDTVTSDRQDGFARTTCDIAIETAKFRADFQCKAVLAHYNELFISDFFAWMEERYSRRTPGLFIDFQSVLHLNEQDFKDFREWFMQNDPYFREYLQFEWTPPNRDSGVRLSFLRREQTGLCEGVTWGAAEDYDSAVWVGSEYLRRSINSRLKKSKPSFGSAPNAEQFNFVVIDFTSSPLVEEVDIFEMLYGRFPVSLDATGTTLVSERHDGSGLYFNEDLEWLSGVLIPVVVDGAVREYAVYPNPEHRQHVSDNWTSPPFRFGLARRY